MSIPNIDPAVTCCFSGYRPHKFDFSFNKSSEQFIRLESDIMEAILKSIADGYNTFLCGGAMGFDLLCGEIVLLIKSSFPDIRLISVIPFAGQEKSFSSEWKACYKNVTENSDLIHIVCSEYSKNSFFKRNCEMVSSSSRIITYFDGCPGGTANTMALAQRENLDILNIYKLSGDDDNLTYYTGC